MERLVIGCLVLPASVGSIVMYPSDQKGSLSIYLGLVLLVVSSMAILSTQRQLASHHAFREEEKWLAKQENVLRETTLSLMDSNLCKGGLVFSQNNAKSFDVLNVDISKIQVPEIAGSNVFKDYLSVGQSHSGVTVSRIWLHQERKVTVPQPDKSKIVHYLAYLDIFYEMGNATKKVSVPMFVVTDPTLYLKGPLPQAIKSCFSTTVTSSCLKAGEYGLKTCNTIEERACKIRKMKFNPTYRKCT